MPHKTDPGDHQPLFSNRFLFRATLVIALLAGLMAVISIAGRHFGAELAVDGHSAARDVNRIILGQDVLKLPSNMIRFDRQRRSGSAEIVNIYLSWPDLAGFSPDRAGLFSDPAGSRQLIFAEFTQSVMSRDMSGRLEPIYSKLFVGAGETGPAGLTLHRLNPRTGFGPEVIYTGDNGNGETYVVRCMIPSDGALSNSADCQRDIHVGRDLSLLYRFSLDRLPEWKALDAAMKQFAAGHLAE